MTLPSRALEPVITYTVGAQPDPMTVRDIHGRIRVWDKDNDRYGWAEMVLVVWDDESANGG